MLENDMIRSIINERIARAAVLSRPAAAAPVTPGYVRVWGPRASRRTSPDPSIAMANVRIPEPRDPRAATGAAGQSAVASVKVVAVPGPRRPAAMASHSGMQVVDA